MMLFNNPTGNPDQECPSGYFCPGNVSCSWRTEERYEKNGFKPFLEKDEEKDGLVAFRPYLPCNYNGLNNNDKTALNNSWCPSSGKLNICFLNESYWNTSLPNYWNYTRGTIEPYPCPKGTYLPTKKEADISMCRDCVEGSYGIEEGSGGSACTNLCPLGTSGKLNVSYSK